MDQRIIASARQFARLASPFMEQLNLVEMQRARQSLDLLRPQIELLQSGHIQRMLRDANAIMLQWDQNRRLVEMLRADRRDAIMLRPFVGPRATPISRESRRPNLCAPLEEEQEPTFGHDEEGWTPIKPFKHE